MTVSILDVAAKAGVSIATVSRVLTNKPYVREEVKERVLSAVKELNYGPTGVARSFRTQKSSVIALIVSDVQNPFFTSIVRAVQDVAWENQYFIFLCNTDEDVKLESQYIDFLISEKVAGAIIAPTQEKNSPVKKLLDDNIPVVCFDRRINDLPWMW